MKKLIFLLFIPIVFGCSSNDTKSKKEKEEKRSIEAGIKITLDISGNDLNNAENTIEIIKNRIYNFLENYPKVETIENSKAVILKISKNRKNQELSGVDFTVSEIDRIKYLIETIGQLEFWHTLNGKDFWTFFVEVDGLFQAKLSNNNKQDSKLSDIEQLLGSDEDSSQNQSLLSTINWGENNPPVVLTTSPSNRKVIINYLNDEEVKSLLNRYTNEYPKFLWGQQLTNEFYDEVELYVLKGNQEDEADLNGSVVVDASQQFAVDGVTPTVSIQMNSTGAKKWEEMTEIAYNERSQIAIVLDGIVYSVPFVTSGPISGGQSSISGAFTITEAQDLANILKAGKLPLSVKVVKVEKWNE